LTVIGSLSARIDVIERREDVYGRQSANRLDEASEHSIEGARAALESFYHSFNQGSLEVLRKVWLDDPLIRLNNPLGGIVEGINDVSEVYDRIFNGPAGVWVEFYDIVEYRLGDSSVVFAGRERGEFTKDGQSVELDIRTSRVFGYQDGRWAQVHHHGSITDTATLDRYRRAVTGEV
jgi:ketosteroid isomerase-like protein